MTLYLLDCNFWWLNGISLCCCRGPSLICICSLLLGGTSGVSSELLSSNPPSLCNFEELLSGSSVLEVVKYCACAVYTSHKPSITLSSLFVLPSSSVSLITVIPPPFPVVSMLPREIKPDIKVLHY